MSRSYRLMCPIARALDRIGDRWTLLILRDLYAGPMRFGEIRSGLPGLATNLLTTRLNQLVVDGLAVKRGGVYSLTELGRRSSGVLWELAQLGLGFPADPDIKQPGHLRLVAVTMEKAMTPVVGDEPDLVAELVLDGESFTLRLEGGTLSVRYGAPDSPDVVAVSSYVPFMGAAGGEISMGEFLAGHLSVSGQDTSVVQLSRMMGRTMVESFGVSMGE
ncbi:MAG: DNA-binding HxlR family transcriptional regulator [Cognaticolwellia sp.]|jgi:DNA-binding HxlR family transcriptional regulator